MLSFPVYSWFEVFGTSAGQKSSTSTITSPIEGLRIPLRTEGPFVEREAVPPRSVVAHRLDVLEEIFRVSSDT